MDLTGWLIVIVPFVCVIAMALYTRKYIRGVADFLVAGRVAGRYVICVADLEAGLGVITLVAAIEARYQSGYGIVFWESLILPTSIIMSFTGYCVYRFRETKAMSLGQFLEMRYNRPLRIFASTLKTVADMLANMIGPAVAARFFIYLLGIPHKVEAFGYEISSFVVLMVFVLLLALTVIMVGGQLALLVTDCLQGLMSYPIFVIFTVFLLTHFSWFDQIAPTMLDRAPGESYFNPFDVQELRDFNIFALFVTIVTRILNRGSTLGTGTSGAGRTPHEQKMAGVFGNIRSGFSFIMNAMLAMGIITALNHKDFAETADNIRKELSFRVAEEVVTDTGLRGALTSALAAIPVQRHQIGIDPPLSIHNNLDSTYINTAAEELSVAENGPVMTQEFRTLYNQMMLPITMRHILPPALLAIFCLLMLMLMLSTDDSRIFNSSMTIAQDIILPLLKRPLTPLQHLWLIRLCCVAVAVFFFCGSLFMAQLDYINLFVVITSSIWLGGAGPVILFGLYSRFGTTAGAFAALITGSGVSLAGIFCQRNWADMIYPWLERNQWTVGVGHFLETVSYPFWPFVEWHMDAIKCPINSQEFYFIAIVTGIAAYCLVSWLTFRRPYNLDKMLHRGKYAIDGAKKISSPWTWKNVYGKLIGITPEYSRGDRIITWVVFCYTFVYGFVIMFLGMLLWNAVDPWPAERWCYYFIFKALICPSVVCAFATVLFTVGGIIDMRRLFRDLAIRKENPLDDGRVEGNVSLADKEQLDQRDSR